MARSDEGALILQISADVDAIRKSMKRAAGEVDLGFNEIEKRGKRGASALEGQFRSAAGQAGILGNALAGLGGPAVGAAAVLGGLALAAGQARKAMAFGDAIADSAQKIGVSTDTLQEYRSAIHAVGGEYADADTALSSFTEKLGKAQLGFSAKAVKPFTALGLDPKSLGEADSAIGVVLDRLSKLNSEAQRQGLANALGLEKFVPLAREGGEAVNDLRQRAHEFGTVMDGEVIAALGDANDQLDELNQKIDVQLNTAFAQLTPLALGLATALAQVATGGRAVVDAFSAIPNKTSDGLRSQLAGLINKQSRFPLELEPAQREIYNRNAQEIQRLQLELSRRDAEAVAARSAPKGGGLTPRSLATPKTLSASERARLAAEKDGRFADGLKPSFETYNFAPPEPESYGTFAGLSDFQARRQADQQRDLSDRIRDASRESATAIGQAFDKLEIGEEARQQLRDDFRFTFGDGVIAALHGDLGGFFQNLADNFTRRIADNLGGQIFDGLFSGGAGALGLGNLLGFADGGSFTVGGQGGIDKNLVAFKATKGERVSIETPDQQRRGGAGGVSLAISIDARGAGPREVDALKGELALLKRQLPGIITGTVNEGIDRRQINAVAAA